MQESQKWTGTREPTRLLQEFLGRLESCHQERERRLGGAPEPVCVLKTGTDPAFGPQRKYLNIMTTRQGRAVSGWGFTRF